MGRLYEFQLELLSENNEIQLNQIIGTNVTVRVELPEGMDTRY
ncbi:MAG: hypothetical protein R3F37_19115 [Candidatus Competibacteraceae bacterium]